MKMRGFIVACFVFLVLFSILYWSEHRKPAAGGAENSPDIPPVILKLDRSAVSRLELKKKNAAPILLTKGNSGSWQVTEPTPFVADQETVSSMLFALSSLNSERLVEEKATDLKRYGLAAPAIEVDITEKNNRTQKLLLGDDTPAGGAVYAMLAGDPRVFTISSFSKNSVDKTADDLRSKKPTTKKNE
jgi:hypothetical protein